MCEGPIVNLSGIKKAEVRKSFLTNLFKNFLERITYYPTVVDSDQSKVNMCLRCGDLEIGEEWQRIPYPQKPIISKEVEAGRITINGSLTVCDFCVFVEKEIQRKREDLYTDQQTRLEIFPVSSMSF